MTDKDVRPYIVLADEFPRHPKTLDLSDAGFRAVIELWCYCNEYRTDGQVPRGHLKRTYPKVLGELLDLGFIEATADGYQMHDYLKHQKSAAEIDGAKAKKAAWGKWGAHQRYHKTARDPECTHCNGEPKPHG